STRAGVSISRRRGSRLPSADAAGCGMLLRHPRVELAVCEFSPGSIRDEGLALDECSGAVLAGFGARGDEPSPLETVDLPECMRLLVECVAPDGAVVANVEDSAVAAEFFPGQARVVAVAADGEHPFLATHRQAGGAAVFFEGSRAVFVLGDD